MSVSSDSVVCTKCDYVTTLHYQPISLIYEIDGKQFQTGRVYGWCAECDNIENVEPIFDKAKIKNKIYPLINEKIAKTNFFTKIFGSSKLKSITEEISNLDTQLNIAERRFSPQRCLSCGSARVKNIESLEGEIISHKCGGHLIKNQGKEEDEIRFIFKHEIIHLNFEGLRLDRNLYRLKRSIQEPSEFMLIDAVQEVIDGDYDIVDLLKSISEDSKIEINDAEVSFFNLSLMSYVIFRFSDLSNRDDLLDQMTEIQINDISHLYEEGSGNLLLANYRNRYKEYFMDFELMFDPNAANSNPALYLAKRLFENVTGKPSKSHFKDILTISNIIGDHLVRKTNFVRKKINTMVA